jgi:hypothetical protein
MSTRLGTALLCTMLLCIVTRNSFSQIPNSGFENWTNGNPDGWATSNVDPVVVNVTKTSVSHTGAYALRGDVVSLFTGSVQPIIQVGPEGRGFAYNQQPAMFTGYYEYFPQSGDRFAINVGLYKGGIDGILVAIAAAALPTAISSYTQFSAPFVYQTNDTPDTCIVQIQIVGPSTGSDYHIGSYFILDDIALSGTVGVSEETENIPTIIQLKQNYPNPFNPNSTIAFDLPKATYVTLTIYNTLGQQIVTLVDAQHQPGRYDVQFDGSKLTSGVYLYRLTADGFTQTKKMLLLK